MRDRVKRNNVLTAIRVVVTNQVRFIFRDTVNSFQNSSVFGNYNIIFCQLRIFNVFTDNKTIRADSRRHAFALNSKQSIVKRAWQNSPKSRSHTTCDQTSFFLIPITMAMVIRNKSALTPRWSTIHLS